MAQLQAIWNKFNPRERLSAIGAGVIILGWLISLTSFGVGGSVLAVLAGLVVLAVLYVKHAPTMNVAWPVDPSLINLAVSALAALLVLVGLLAWLGILGIYGSTATIALLVTVVGTAIMTWGAWQEYAAVKPALPAFLTSGSTAGTTASPAASAPPVAAQTAPPAAPPAAPAVPPAMTSLDDHDEAPPA